MAGRYSQTFTLKDIFNNPNLKGKIPLINYKEKEMEDGKVSYRTNAKTVNRQVFDTSMSSARPFYKGIKGVRAGDRLEISGELTGDHNQAVEAVYQGLLGIRSLITWTANNADMIRSALKEAEKNKRAYGINSKLNLRVQSMQEIEGMSRQQLQALMSDIMENVVYGDNFPQTQKKYNVEQLTTKSPFNYNQRQLNWKNKVGEA